MMRSMHHHCYPSMPDCCMPQPGWFFYYPVVCVPVYCSPPTLECAEEACDGEEMTVAQQVDATGTATSSTVLVGGHGDAYLTVEYLVESGATGPSVTVTAADPGGATSTWTDTGLSVGFHVQERFLGVKPGTKLSLAVNNVTARLRWCESICC